MIWFHHFTIQCANAKISSESFFFSFPREFFLSLKKKIIYNLMLANFFPPRECTHFRSGEVKTNFSFGTLEIYQIRSDQISRSVVSDSLQPQKSQHTRPPCPSPTPGVHSDSCPSSQWCHPVISSSVIPFSSCPQSLPASESFPVSQLFAWGGWPKYWSFSFSIIPSKEIPGLISFRMDWLDLLNFPWATIIGHNIWICYKIWVKNLYDTGTGSSDNAQ